MKASVKLQNTRSASTSSVIMKLALLGSLVLGSMYVVLKAIAELTKAL